jgi:hypothetical protein
VIGLLWFFVSRHDPLDNVCRILAERYARDELGAEEYRKRLDELARDKRPDLRRSDCTFSSDRSIPRPHSCPRQDQRSVNVAR